MTRRAWMMAAAMAVLGAACGTAAQTGDARSAKLRISWTDFKKLHDSGKVAIVDVRDAESFAAGHIPGARSVAADQIEKRAGELKKLKVPIVTYCA